MEDRLGRFNTDGSYAKYPKFDVLGNPADRPPAAILGLSDNAFVVLPSSFTPEGEQIAEYQSWVKPVRAIGRKSDDNE